MGAIVCGPSAHGRGGQDPPVGWRARLETGPRCARGLTLSTFTPEHAAALPGAPWLQQRRTAAAEAFASGPLPTEKEEVWRYSRIDDLDLDRYPAPGSGAHGSTDAPGPSASDRVRSLVDELGPRSGLMVTINGVLASVASTAPDESMVVGRLAEHPEAAGLLGSVTTQPGDFVLLNDAFTVDPLVIDVAPGASVADPVIVVHLVTGTELQAVFPRLVVRAGAGASAAVVEIVVDAGSDLLGGSPDSPGSAPEHLVVPVTELLLADDASVDYVSIQSLGPTTWQLAHQASVIGARADLQSFAAALGGGYARLRTDSALSGESGTSRLRAAYLGRDDQMLDFRTLQDHQAPKTTSDLLFMGAVADTAHSVYSGLIRVRRGAVRADAMQTNHNLVLDEGAHADSVPNLDIEENDVRCSHGSTVGPVDEDQRYYLESRGVEPEMAERLIVAGFFEDIASQVPVPGTRATISRALATRTGVHGV
jgi:Fe-S cluster assembly protein SufD